MSKRTYITKRIVTETNQHLSPADWRIIYDVERLGLASGAQLRRLHYDPGDTGRRTCRLHLARLTEQRVLTRLGRRIGGVHSGSDGFVYTIDVLGQRLLQPNRKRFWPPRTPGEAFLAHALQVADLYVALRLAERGAELRLRCFDAEPRCWRHFAGAGGARAVLKPDAYVLIERAGFEDHFFIEVDRATESLPRIVDKARSYVRYWQSGREQARHGVFPLVLWSTPSDHRSAQLIDAISRVGAEHWRMFSVTTHERAAELMCSDRMEVGRHP